MSHTTTCKSQDKVCNNASFDVIIVGAGPAGLATLSALRNEFTLDHLNDIQRNQILNQRSRPKGRKVCVLDPSGDWMTGWNQNFAKLDIGFLRSPALAHPDAFDETALLAFAVAQGREAELKASGCSDEKRLRGLGEAHNGLWNMPSTQLFRDFCRHTARGLDHEFCHDSVVQVERVAPNKKANQTSYRLILQSGRILQAKNIVLAMGALGEPIVPKGVASAPTDRIMHWKQLPHDKTGNTSNGIPSHWNNILVVGGGLTAVQVSQLALKNSGRTVTLCSRRPLVEKHLDIGLDWVDRRQAQKCQSDFYHQPLESRLEMLKQARGGGSVPPCYIREVEALERQGRLTRMVGNAHLGPTSDQDHLPLNVEIDSQQYKFDGIIVACGVRPNCRANPVCQSLLENITDGPMEMSGFPIISEDLEWLPNIFVVGGMASLNLGPDAGNLMGMRRAATLVVNALGCRSWLRDTGNIFANRYSLFEDDSSESESDDDSVADSTADSYSSEELQQPFLTVHCE